jgi:hypothetical protein
MGFCTFFRFELTRRSAREGERSMRSVWTAVAFHRFCTATSGVRGITHRSSGATGSARGYRKAAEGRRSPNASRRPFTLVRNHRGIRPPRHRLRLTSWTNRLRTARQVGYLVSAPGYAKRLECGAFPPLLYSHEQRPWAGQFLPRNTSSACGCTRAAGKRRTPNASRRASRFRRLSTCSSAASGFCIATGAADATHAERVSGAAARWLYKSGGESA